MTTSNTQDIHI